MSRRVRGLLDRLLTRRRGAAGDGVSDAELLHRYARDRDEAAFELLVWRHGAMVLGLCRRALRDEQHAEDAFQAVFLVLARKAGAVRGNLGGWLFKVARRVSNRAAARQPETHPITVRAGAMVPDAAERNELAELLDAEVARLPARLREPVVLCYLGEMSTADAARELGCPRGTVLSRLAAARARLAERLTRRGVALPAVLALGAPGLTARGVSATVAAAKRFLLGSGSLVPSFSLAHGAIHAMNRTALFTALGGALLAAALASGVGLVTAQSGPRAADANAAPTAPTAPSVPNAPQPPKPEPAAPKDAEEKLTKLARFADALRTEIEESERAIGRSEREAGASDASLAALQKRLANLEQQLSRTQLELDRFEAESKVLKKRLEDKPENAPLLPDAVGAVLEADPNVFRAKAALEEAKALLVRESNRALGADHPYLKELAMKVNAAEKALAEVRAEARSRAAATVRAKQRADLQKRVDELTLLIEVKQAECAKLRVERDALAKAIAALAGANSRAEELRKSLEPRREMLATIERQILVLRAQKEGVQLPAAQGTDAKLDAILKELGALRKEVQELKNQRE